MNGRLGERINGVKWNESTPSCRHGDVRFYPSSLPAIQTDLLQERKISTVRINTYSPHCFFYIRCILSVIARQIVYKDITAVIVNRPFLSWSKPLFQSEAKCKAIDKKMTFHSHANKTRFHKARF